MCATAREVPRNPYDILGLPKDVEEAAVRQAFKSLAATLHPDVVGTGDEAAFRDALWAYKELSDPLRRQRWLPRDDLRENTEYDLEDTFQDDEEWRSYATVESEWEDLRELAMQDWFSWELWQNADGDIEELRRLMKEWQESPTVTRNLIEGTYQAHSWRIHHGKPIYFKDNVEDGRDVLIYFWDGRDGEKQHGWWIGPKIGSGTVFAFSSSKIAKPPLGDWRVPVGGLVDDSLQIASREGGLLQISFSSLL